MKKKLSTVVEKLDVVCDRLSIMEGRQKALEEDSRASSSSSSYSPHMRIAGKRTQKTSPDLQVSACKYTSCSVCDVMYIIILKHLLPRTK